MAKKLAIVIHRETNAVICIKSKTDLASFLEVSLSTVIRKYNDVGMYQSGIYTIYIGVEYYQSDKEKNYKHDIVAPIVNTSIDNQRQQIANNVVIMTKNDQVVIQNIEDELEEDNLVTDADYHAYYSTKTVDDLTRSKTIFRHHSKRIAVIDFYANKLLGIVID